MDYPTINESYIVRTDLGGDSFEFADAAYYHGEVYVAQRANNKQLVKLIRMKQNPDDLSLSFNGEWQPGTKHTSYVDIALQVWADKLFVFWTKDDSDQYNRIHYRYYWFDEQGNFVTSDEFDLYVNDLQKGEGDAARNRQIRVAVCEGKLYVAYLRGSGNGYKSGTLSDIAFRVASDTNPLIDNHELVWENPELKRTLRAYPDQWDIAVWNGFTSKNEPGEELLLSLATREGEAGNLQTYALVDEDWQLRSDFRVDNLIYSYDMKMIQASIRGNEYTGNAANPMLIVMPFEDTQSNLIYEIYPQAGKDISRSYRVYNTGTDDGRLGVTASLLPEKEDGMVISNKYRQYIHIISAWQGDANGNKCTTIQSNVSRLFSWFRAIGISKQEDIELMEKCPDLRKLISLVAVVEGPPPALLNDEKHIKENTEQPLTRFCIGRETSESYSTRQTIDFTLSTGMDFLGSSITAGYHFAQTIGKSETLTEYISKTWNMDTKSDCKGSLLYVSPGLTLYTMSLYDTEGEERVPGYLDLVTIEQSGMVLNEVNYDFAQGPTGMDPSFIWGWDDRNKTTETEEGLDWRNLFQHSSPSQAFQTKQGGGATTASMHREVTSEKEVTHGFFTATDLNVMFFPGITFQLKTNTTFDFTSTVQTSLKNGVNIDYAQIDHFSDPEVCPSMYSFFYMLNSGWSNQTGNAELTNAYYEALQNMSLDNASSQQVMREEEKPIIYTWYAMADTPANRETIEKLKLNMSE